MQTSKPEIPSDRTTSPHPDSVALEGALIRQLFERSLWGVYGAMAGSVALVIAMWGKVAPSWLLIWLALFLVTQLARRQLSRAFYRAGPQGPDSLPWGRWFAWMSGTTALLWGLAGMFFFPASSAIHQTLLMAVLAGVAASTAVAHAPVTYVYVPNVLLILAPTSARFMYDGNEAAMVVGVMALIFALALLGTARAVHCWVADSVELKLGQERLIESFKQAGEDLRDRIESRSRQLEEANQRLMTEMEERELYGEKLRVEKLRFERLADNLPFGVVFLDRERVFRYVNPAFRKLFGYESDEAVDGLEWSRIAFPDREYRKSVSSLWNKDVEFSAPGKQTELQFVAVSRDGSSKTILAKRVGFENGDQLVTLEDVTERTKYERALQESEERYRSLAQNSLTGIYIQQDGRFTYVNERLCQMMGYSQEELLGVEFWTFVHPEDRPLVKQRGLARSTAERGSGYDAFRVVCKDGRTKWFDVLATTIQHRGATANMGNVADVTKRKRAETELRKSEEKYRNILETIADGYHEVNLKGVFTLINDSLCEMMGTSREELLGKSYLELMDAENAKMVFDRYNQVYVTGRPDPGFLLELITSANLKKTVSISISLIKNELGESVGFRGILRDITERRRLEDQLRHAAKMEAIGQLAGGIAHDFNNLLTAMIGYSNMLLQQMAPDSEYRDKLNQISRAGMRAAELTQQLLAFSRKQVLEVRVIDLNSVISDMEEMLRRLIGEPIELTTSEEADLGPIRADLGQIEQIIMNLAVNARDAMPGGGALTIETANAHLDESYARSHSEVTPGDYVMLVVTDTGSGIDEKTRSRIFDPFFTTKEKGVGTGLGLSTVYGIVKQHQGHIAVYSEPGRGSSFKVYFPRIDAPAKEAPQTVTKRRERRGNETVLLVEDEEIVRELAREALTLMGYNTLSASCPEEAIEISAKHHGPIDLLLTDVVMPRMDGRTLFTHLSPGRPEMKALYISGYTENFIVRHGVLERGVNFMHKPFDMATLASRVREALDSE